ncbi:MAG: TlpA family protein disulfide reductase [Acidobacteria bacterium]|nr:TlpA family protein disulfide reductase [Acidobacteriota bacterium]MCI0627348.1 TlpA family protein disulfide reductase [Acidobacteriota bacterium]MCI0723348.1 TlpA family protein disulfide reductase [Acidobacteriota bacterium]
MKRYWRFGAANLACLLAWLFLQGSLFSPTDRDVERKIIEYLKANLKAGEPVIVSKLHNEVFTAPEERKVLDRLYNIFFKVPAYIAQYYASSNKPPTLVEIAHQFNLTLEGEVDVILKIIEYDRRVPKFMTRDAKTGEIAQVDIEKVKADPRFNKVIERSITGWEGKTAPSFAVQALDGKEIKSSDFKAKAHLVYFWFTHCPPCVQITPHLVSLQRKFAGRNFTVVGLNADNVLELGYEDSERKAYLEKHKINFPIGHLTTAAQTAYGGVQLFPTLFLVDKDGVIRAHFVNYKDEATLHQAIEKVL